MSTMIEVYLGPLATPECKKVVEEIAAQHGGRITFTEVSGVGSNSICLTIEFAYRQSAEAAFIALQSSGTHVEGPMDYGND